jgi:hypothetical protein
VNTLDQSRLLTEQDYGGFLEVATLYEHEGRFLLHVSAGYGAESCNDDRWYELSARPPKPLAEYASGLWLDPCRDQSVDFACWFGVDAHQAERPS